MARNVVTEPTRRAPNRPWEIGSEFHWHGRPKGARLAWPSPSAWFALGRQALATAWKQSPIVSPTSRLWVPDYFCPDVTEFLHRSGDVRRYADDPRWSNPDWDTLRPDPGDLVLAVNYFGIRAGDSWRTWHDCHPNVLLVEDHTHDPWSAWARRSVADYAFVSARKLYPVPDGAILWSPSGWPVPASPVSGDWQGSALKLAAMALKAQYLAGRAGPSIKGLFREWQVRGETLLVSSRMSGASPWSSELLEEGIPVDWRSRRAINTREFLRAVAQCDLVVPLFQTWPDGHVPFNPIVLCPPQARNCIRQQLISEGIYCPIHWLAEPNAPGHVTDLASRILTIPLDQRYRKSHVADVVARLDTTIRNRDW